MSDSEKLRILADVAWQHRLSCDPYLRARVGLPVTHIPAPTLQEAEDDAGFARDLLSRLATINAAALSHADVLTLEFLQDSLEQGAREVDLWWAGFPATPYSVYWLNVYGKAIFQAFQFVEKADAARYISLLHDYAVAVASLSEKLRMQAARGWRIPRPALPGAKAILQGIRAGAPALLGLNDGRLSGLDAADAAAVKERAARSVQEEILPAFDALLGALDDDYARLAPEGVGIGQYPGGPAAYALLVREHVTYDIAPERIHQIGLESVAELTEEMRQTRARLGFTGAEPDFMEQLRASGKLYATSPEQVEQRFQGYVRRLQPHLSHYFSVLPQAPYEVRRLDPALEAGMTYGFYEPPTPERPIGVYFYNGSGLATRSQLAAAALIYHELVPGHHFHIARQNENEALPELRRKGMNYSAYNEGWAEYASGLVREIGLYDDPYDLYGRLANERFLAQRLVIDTGMNVLGWSLEQGRQYMRANTLEGDAQIASETLRYSTDLPGQALAYRLGYLKMKELRARAERALGPAFALPAFHEAILGPGALPLAVLDRHIDHCIASAKAAS
jgi:uncharacterized protein (DUF885 family)